MTDAAKRERAAYIKQWKEKHPEKQRQYNEAYWERKAQRAEEAARDGSTPKR